MRIFHKLLNRLGMHEHIYSSEGDDFTCRCGDVIPGIELFEMDNALRRYWLSRVNNETWNALQQYEDRPSIH